MAQAARARRRRRYGKALALYQQVLKREPDNPDLLRKVAPLMARTGQEREAWSIYQKAARRLRDKGFAEQAIGVLREASQNLPNEVATYTSIAELEVERQRRADAIGALLTGRRHFRASKHRGQALELLRVARKIEPGNFEVNFDIAGILASSGARDRARRLLQELAARSNGNRLRRVRRRQFFLFPSPVSGWRWMVSWFSA
jgi:thioredoxin-like negative regulator of GroEL